MGGDFGSKSLRRSVIARFMRAADIFCTKKLGRPKQAGR
jgi:hypothetical protein